MTKAPARLSLKEQCFFAKRLSFLIIAGTPLQESLAVLCEQAAGRGQRYVLQQLAEDVMSGRPLSKSLARFPRVFGDFTISLVRVGEASGTLSENLHYLAEELQKRQVLKTKMIGALLYPALISVATLGIVGFLMLYLFPKLLPVFQSLHASLPLFDPHRDKRKRLPRPLGTARGHITYMRHHGKHVFAQAQQDGACAV